MHINERCDEKRGRRVARLLGWLLDEDRAGLVVDHVRVWTSRRGRGEGETQKRATARPSFQTREGLSAHARSVLLHVTHAAEPRRTRAAAVLQASHAAGARVNARAVQNEVRARNQRVARWTHVTSSLSLHTAFIFATSQD